MTTTWKIILGVMVLALIVVSFVAIKNSGADSEPTPAGPTPRPEGCDPNRPGYNVYGWKSDVCGQAYEPECNPEKPGYDVNGLPNINCGFGGRTSINR